MPSGIFGYSFLEENLDKLKGAVVDGVSPTYETVPRASIRPRVRSSST